MPSPTLPATLTRPQWLRLGALLLAALWLTMGLLGFLLLNKQHQLMLDLAVSRAAVIAGDIDATLQTAQRSGLTLDETQSLQSLLQRLQGQHDRRARFVSTLVAIRSADDPEPLVAVGRWQGEILAAPRGAGGFGYDPLMFIPALGKSVADLDAATKNAHSHRALAAAQMLALMHESWHLG